MRRAGRRTITACQGRVDCVTDGAAIETRRRAGTAPSEIERRADVRGMHAAGIAPFVHRTPVGMAKRWSSMGTLNSTLSALNWYFALSAMVVMVYGTMTPSRTFQVS